MPSLVIDFSAKFPFIRITPSAQTVGEDLDSFATALKRALSDAQKGKKEDDKGQ